MTSGPRRRRAVRRPAWSRLGSSEAMEPVLKLNRTVVRPTADVEVDAGAGASKLPSSITMTSGIIAFVDASVCPHRLSSGLSYTSASARVRREPSIWAQLVEVAPLYVGTEERSEFRELSQSSVETGQSCERVI